MKRRTKPTSPIASAFNYTAMAVIAGVLVLGIGIGMAISSTATLTPQNVASSEFIDRSAPNPEICVKFGASAMVTDLRVFVTLNPFSVFVAQPRMQPGCVLRTSNWALLRQRNLITVEEERDCKHRMNTFGYTGDLNDDAEVSCIYQNNSAQNDFLNQSGLIPNRPRPESDRF
ncbi:DUF3172 domain-containing protein [Limnospira fusiformis KN01]|uniref:DUF3172 domain-containing protein n=2 Tax=Limnospira TaxID=2596745 RepID=A0A9P1KDD4_9CYAN|nr:MULTISPECIES: DUF3172 domain-containing protein [Limnospira]EKD11323.1 hypothetical protein SPLC1_S031530 [Arthrospira platensis C1]MDY7052832.1 DUF3172 domain-containing protein [Limnospira fusiformis LS22]QJB27511.1 DUF3172 domain-containing protein [Limnospira fusiformis SAG 85.79]MDT9186964.1 DUF3172 domain-containing protein [Limnospira sp. PMC 894.15]MDT9198075.1 DUF3172 domain-containing protein [Limnospira sp. PMC 1042.18]